jgi:hypothetical protein
MISRPAFETGTSTSLKIWPAHWTHTSRRLQRLVQCGPVDFHVTLCLPFAIHLLQAIHFLLAIFSSDTLSTPNPSNTLSQPISSDTLLTPLLTPPLTRHPLLEYAPRRRNQAHYMVVVRKWGEDHISKSLKQIDTHTWLIGNVVLHRSPFPSATATWNDSSDNSSYTLTEASLPLPATTTPANSPYIKLIHEAGDASAVWSIGSNAICKVRYIDCRFTIDNISGTVSPTQINRNRQTSS